MLGVATSYLKTTTTQRRRIDVPETKLESNPESNPETKLEPNNESNTKHKPNPETKLEQRHKLKTNLINKYFNKIINNIIKAIYNDKTHDNFHYNYYEFLNKKMGHPHLIVNEILYEMSYQLSEYSTLDDNGNIMTFKTLFGDNFRWKLVGKNNILFEW